MPTHVFQPGPGEVKSIEMLGASTSASPINAGAYKLGKNDMKGGTLNLSRFLLRFDLSGFVKKEAITAASLDLNVVSLSTPPPAPDPVPIAAMYMLYPTDRDWNKNAGEASWFFKDKITTPPEILWSSTQDTSAPVGENNNGGAGTTPSPK